ncbi:hypothetical protein EJ110_NYTH48059 [Nymphaea thermarum]|nr:hypothetical protein EJ110_NYTH48059 [Nymphaea thermarum]
MSEISSEANTSSFVSSGEMKSSPFSSIINKMNGGNYEMWAMQVKRTLIAHDKEHLILEPEPVQKVGKYITWFKDNSLVMVWIVGTLSQDIANEVLHKESAKDMWDSLAATYSQARNETRIMQLHHDIQQDGRPLHTYYSSLKSMFERLNSYFPACRCEQQKAYRDMLMVGVFLSGLDSVYESAKNQMLTSPSIPPIDEAYSRLSRIPIPAATVHDTTSAMLATRGRGGSFFARGRGGRGRSTLTPRPVCQFCHRIGHTVDKCWQKHGRPAFANQIASTESSEPPKAQHIAPSSELRVDDLLSQLRSLIGDRPQHAPDPTTSTVTTAATASSSSVDPRFGAVYQRRTRPVAPAPCAPVPSPSMPKVYTWKKTDVVETDVVANVEGTNPNPVSAPDDPSPIDEELPIALRKGSRSCTSHPIQRFVSYAKLMAKFLSGLSSEYSVAKSQILTGSELPDLADTYNRLSRFAATLAQTMHDTPVSALVISGGRGPSSFGGTRGRGTGRGAGRGRFQCSYCGKIGHLEDRCWDKHPHLRSNVSSGRGGGRITTSRGPSSSQATHSKATISMVESSTDPSISMSYSLNLSKDEYDRVLAQRSASTSTSTSTNAAVVDSAFSVGAPTADPDNSEGDRKRAERRTGRWDDTGGDVVGQRSGTMGPKTGTPAQQKRGLNKNKSSGDGVTSSDAENLRRRRRWRRRWKQQRQQ